MSGSAWSSYRTVGAEPVTLSRSEAAPQRLVRCCVRNRPRYTRHLFFKRRRGGARRGSKGPSSFLGLEAPMVRLYYQSRKQQAQPEKGLPCCQGWLPRGGRENSHWWGRGRLSFSPNSRPLQRVACFHRPATNNAKGSESSLNTTMYPSLCTHSKHRHRATFISTEKHAHHCTARPSDLSTPALNHTPSLQKPPGSSDGTET